MFFSKILINQSFLDLGHFETVKVLVDRGADVTIKDVNGRTAYNIAVKKGTFKKHIKTYKILTLSYFRSSTHCVALEEGINHARIEQTVSKADTLN